MFIRPCYRKKNGKRHAYWALVESYRTERGPRQRVVAYLGQLKDSQRRGVKRAAESKRRTPYQQLQLFDHDAKLEPEWVEVDTANVRVENELDFGGPWLACEITYASARQALRKRHAPWRGRHPVGQDGVGACNLPVVQSVQRTLHCGALLPKHGDARVAGHSGRQDQPAATVPSVG